MKQDVQCKGCVLDISYLDDSCPGCNKATGFAIREQGEATSLLLTGGYVLTLLITGCARLMMQ